MQIQKFSICSGVENEAKDKTIKHSVPRVCDPLFNEDISFKSYEVHRHKDCYILVESSTICSSCESIQKSNFKVLAAKEKRLRTPAKRKAPVSSTAPERIKLTLQSQRLQCVEHTKTSKTT